MQTSGLTMKGSRKALHHLFKSDIKPLKKNVSFQKGIVKIEELDHSHWFHSINSQLKTQSETTHIAGHFHEVTWGVDTNGRPVITSCSPPIHYKYESRPSGQKRVKARVEWFDADRGQTVVDSHVHNFEYRDSEELSELSVRRLQQDSSQTLLAQMSEVIVEDHGGDAA